MPIYDAVFRYNQEHESAMPLVVPANEQGAGFMAAGFAPRQRQGRRRAGNLRPRRHQHRHAGARQHGGLRAIVVICGQVPTTAIGTDAFQEAPVPSIMGAVAKHVFLVTDPTKLEATVRTAFEIARTGRPGRWCSTFPRMCRIGREYSTVPGACLFPVTGSA